MKKIVVTYILVFLAFFTDAISQTCVPLLPQEMSSIDICDFSVSSSNGSDDISCTGWMEQFQRPLHIDRSDIDRSDEECPRPSTTIQQSNVFSVNPTNISLGEEFSLDNNRIELLIDRLSPDGGGFLASSTSFLPVIPHICNSEGSLIGLKGSFTMFTCVPSPSFDVRLDNLEIGENYELIFYQAHGKIDPTLNSPKRTHLNWRVSFLEPNSTSLRATIAPSILQSNTTIWQKVTMVFEATSSSHILGFVATALPISSLPPSHVRESILIDNIFISKQGTCDSEPCEDYTSFNPTIAKKYVLSGWVKQASTEQLDSYSEASIVLKVNGQTIVEARATGPIIDGWQQIQHEFEIQSVGNLDIEFQNENLTNPAYFDDIRIHPFDGNMKSFVYDPITQRLVAELDENNYATFYEYDKEGGLVRVKKETERGIKTIQETRSGNSQLNFNIQN